MAAVGRLRTGCKNICERAEQTMWVACYLAEPRLFRPRPLDLGSLITSPEWKACITPMRAFHFMGCQLRGQTMSSMGIATTMMRTDRGSPRRG